MNQIQREGLVRRYRAELRAYVLGGDETKIETAQDLGLQAVSMGLGTVDLVKIHANSLSLESESVHALPGPAEISRRAAAFFTEVITPIEKAHRISLDLNEDLIRLNEKLAQRTVKLAGANHELRSKFAQRKAAEVALQERAEKSSRLLGESLQLQEHLHHLNRHMLASLEFDRKKISLRLQDDIAQSLLAIHVRLLAIGKELTVTSEDFKKEIAKTQRSVAMSVRTIHRFAREFEIEIAHEN